MVKRSKLKRPRWPLVPGASGIPGTDLQWYLHGLYMSFKRFLFFLHVLRRMPELCKTSNIELKTSFLWYEHSMCMLYLYDICSIWDSIPQLSYGTFIRCRFCGAGGGLREVAAPASPAFCSGPVRAKFAILLLLQLLVACVFGLKALNLHGVLLGICSVLES